MKDTKAKLRIYAEVRPTAQSHRKQNIEEELIRLERLEMIKTVNEPTPLCVSRCTRAQTDITE